MGAVTLPGLGLCPGFLPHPGQVGFPSLYGGWIIGGWWGVPPRTDVEQQPGQRSEVVGEQGAVLLVEAHDP